MTRQNQTNLRIVVCVVAMTAGGVRLHSQDADAPKADQSSAAKKDGQVSSSSQPAAEPVLRRFSFGAQVRWWPSQPFYNRYFEADNTNANTGTTYATSSSSSRFGLGPVMDVHLNANWLVRVEGLFQHLEYTKTTTLYTGGGASDGTVNKTYTEHTRTGAWDLPFMAQYHRTPLPAATRSVSSTSSTVSEKLSWLSPRSIFAHAFFEGGGIIRQLTTVRTGNDTLNSDNTTAYNETPVTPSNRRIVGAVVGAGLRFVDDFNLKLMPEVRYIYWTAPTFQSASTLSRTRQIEVDLSLVF